MLLDRAFHLLSDLNLHLGINDIPCDACSKMSIMYSNSGKVGPNKIIPDGLVYISVSAEQTMKKAATLLRKGLGLGRMSGATCMHM